MQVSGKVVKTPLSKVANADRVSVAYGARAGLGIIHSLFSSPKRSIMGFDTQLAKIKSTPKLLNNLLELSAVRLPLNSGIRLSLTSSYFKFKPGAKSSVWHLASANYFYIGWATFYRKVQHKSRFSFLNKEVFYAVMPTTIGDKNFQKKFQVGYDKDVVSFFFTLHGGLG
jgi:hypothetical protein